MQSSFFIGGKVASSGFVPEPKYTRFGAVREGGERMRLGVVSDPHLLWPGDETLVVKAFEYFRDNGADGVLLAGDFADWARYEQVKRLGTCWDKIFPDNKAPDGRHVEKLFIYGNHCMTPWTWGTDFKDKEDLAYREAIGYKNNKIRFWEECFHEEFEPVWLKTVKGIPIVGAHWEWNGEDCSNLIPVHGRRIEAFFKAHGGEFDPKVPLIFTQHDHPKDTCFGPWAWGHDDGTATRVLSAFPNAVAFSGHSHYTLTDDRSVWQGAFTSINTGSLRYPASSYSLRENAYVNEYGFTGEKRKHRMERFRTDNGQGMLVSVWNDHLAIERRDFTSDELLGPDWVVPLPVSDGAPFAFAKHAATRSAPEFDAGAKAAVSVTDPKDAEDFTHIDITFPAAKMIQGCRISEYEVTAVLVEEDVELVQAQRRMMAPDFYLPESKPVSSVTFTFAAEDLLIKGHYRFEVRALECFGKKGGKIISDIIVIC